MRYFIATEHKSHGYFLDLISIAIVAEDGREYYAASSDFIRATASYRVQKHVLPALPDRSSPQWKTLHQIRTDLNDFFCGDSFPEFWGSSSAFDFVLFVQLWGSLDSLPDHFPRICYDLQQYMDFRCQFAPDLKLTNRHSLLTARWLRETYLLYSQGDSNTADFRTGDIVDIDVLAGIGDNARRYRGRGQVGETSGRVSGRGVPILFLGRNGVVTGFCAMLDSRDLRLVYRKHDEQGMDDSNSDE